MRDARACRIGKRMQRVTKRVSHARKLAKKIIGQERYIETAHGPVRVLEYGFEDTNSAPLYVDLHGGGFVLMAADSDEAINLYIREKTGAKIISIDYPKAPDAPFPAALDAVFEVVAHYKRRAAELHLDPSRIGIGGHSAGANLSTAACIRAKENGEPSFLFQILDYPPLDLATDPFTKPTPEKAIPPKIARIFNSCYVEPEEAKNPLVSPIFASPEMLKDLPPAIVLVAGLDSLHDEGVRYAEMLKAAGVETELHDFPQAVHGFTLIAGEDTDRALELMAAFINKHMA